LLLNHAHADMLAKFMDLVKLSNEAVANAAVLVLLGPARNANVMRHAQHPVIRIIQHTMAFAIRTKETANMY
jgi:hypothetical protein